MSTYSLYKGRLILLGIGVLIGSTVVWGYCVFAAPHLQKGCLDKFPLTNQTLDCDEYDASLAQLSALEGNLSTAATLYIEKGRADKISVFVRDLETRQIASVHGTDVFTPASLLKLPLAIAYFKLAQIEPSILKESLVATAPPSNTSQYYQPTQKLIHGESYSVADLIERMIRYSDNDALLLLNNHIDQNVFANTLIDLGVTIPTKTGDVGFVTAKSYAAIFRMLYNASYLNRYYSEKVLDLMAQADFKGIGAPLPQSAVVSHKFGEHRELTQNGSVAAELHDCGIVYKKDANPYTICIMTSGKSLDELKKVIEDISLVVYRSF